MSQAIAHKVDRPSLPFEYLLHGYLNADGKPELAVCSGGTSPA
jgi:hypothetical protein